MKSLVKYTSDTFYKEFEGYVSLLSKDLLNSVMPTTDVEELTEKFKKDPNLNNIRLSLWDNADAHIRPAIIRAYKGQTVSWSLSHTVCTLKHYAIYHLIKATPSFE